MEVTLGLGTAITLLGTVLTIGIAVGGWQAWVSRRDRLEKKLDKRLSELETTGNRTTMETLRWLETTVQRHETYFTMMMQRQWEEQGMIRLRGRAGEEPESVE